MSNTQPSLGTALSNVFQGIVSLLTTGSWHIKDAADQARSADLLLDQVPEAERQDAQVTLDVVNRALTSFNVLEQRLEAAHRTVLLWERNVEAAFKRFQATPDGDPDKAKYEKLSKDAIARKMQAEAVFTQLQQIVETARPQAEAALKAGEEAGFRREHALSEVEVLRIQNASAEATKNLALAAQNGGASQAQSLLEEAHRKIEQNVAAARAGQQLADVLPKTAGQVDREISQLAEDGDVTAEFERMKAAALAATK